MDRFNAIPVKMPAEFFFNKLTNQFKNSYENGKDLNQPKELLKRTNLDNFHYLILSDFKTY